MKFFATALFAAGAIASIVKRQDAGAVGSAIGDIDTATQALTTAINSYDGGDQEPVLNAANALSSAIDAATSAANAIPSELSLQEALQLQDPTEALGSSVQAAVSAAKSKKDTFVSAGTAGIVLSQLQGFQSGSEALISAITSKVPEAASSIVTTLTKPITDALADGISSFSDVPTGGASSSGAAPTSSGAAPTSAVAPTTTGEGIPTGASTHSTPTATPPPFTGAASKAGFGGAAIAALLVAAL